MLQVVPPGRGVHRRSRQAAHEPLFAHRAVVRQEERHHEDERERCRERQ